MIFGSVESLVIFAYEVLRCLKESSARATNQILMNILSVETFVATSRLSGAIFDWLSSSRTIFKFCRNQSVRRGEVCCEDRNSRYRFSHAAATRRPICIPQAPRSSVFLCVNSGRRMLSRSLLGRPIQSFASTGSYATWICANCRSKGLRRWNHSLPPTAQKKPYYVTSPIFYVNAGISSLRA